MCVRDSEKRTDFPQMGVVRPIEKKLLFRVLTEFSSLLKCPEKKRKNHVGNGRLKNLATVLSLSLLLSLTFLLSLAIVSRRYDSTLE